MTIRRQTRSREHARRERADRRQGAKVERDAEAPGQEDEAVDERAFMGKPVFNMSLEGVELDAALPPKPVAFEGWLWKKGKGESMLGRRNWNKRHFRTANWLPFHKIINKRSWSVAHVRLACSSRN